MRPRPFIPPYLLRHVSEAAAARADAREVAERCRAALALDARLRAARAHPPPARSRSDRTPDELAWLVHSADGTTTLPGRPVRDHTQPFDSGDVAVDEAWEGTRATMAMFSDVYARTSYDDAGVPVLATVHFGRDYANAFWDGSHLVFGDGDGRIFHRFTRSVDVIAHEFTHAVVQHTAGLVYRDQPGALNESICDVFAACLEQRVRGQEATEGSWLIGAEIFRAGIDAVALRSMKEPGTAYDDPLLGTDPQPGHMDDYVVTSDDHGGVHINSGIPNRAFYLAAVAIGGSAAEGAGRIWYDALRVVGPETDFVEFAEATVAAAGRHEAAVRDAWQQVGVGAGQREPSSPQAGTIPTSGTVEVRRTGGFAGLTVAGTLELASDDPRFVEVRRLLGEIDFAADPGPAYADEYVFVVRCEEREVAVPEHDLTPALRRLVELVLR